MKYRKYDKCMNKWVVDREDSRHVIIYHLHYVYSHLGRVELNIT